MGARARPHGASSSSDPVVKERYENESNRRAYGVKNPSRANREKLPADADDRAAVRPAHNGVDEHHRGPLGSSGFRHLVSRTRWEVYRNKKRAGAEPGS